jgi:hypothetical protein
VLKGVFVELCIIIEIVWVGKKVIITAENITTADIW